MTPTQPPAHDDLRAQHVEVLREMLALTIHISRRKSAAFAAAIAALSALPEAGEAVGYIDPEADFLLPRAGGCVLMSRMEVSLVRDRGGKYTQPIYTTPQPAPAAITMNEAIDAACGHDNALAAAYRAGWINCTRWAGRDDLIADTDSHAYMGERDSALKALSTPPAAVSQPAAMVEGLRHALCRIAMGAEDAQKIADDALASSARTLLSAGAVQGGAK